MAVVVVALDGRVLERAVHPLDLTVRPSRAAPSIRARRDGDHQVAEGMVHLGQPVLDPVLVADPVEDMLAVPDVLLARGELHAVVGEHRVDLVRDGLDHGFQEACGDIDAGALVQLGERNL